MGLETVNSLVEFVTSTAGFVNLQGYLVKLPFHFVSLLLKFQLCVFICLIWEITRRFCKFTEKLMSLPAEFLDHQLSLWINLLSWWIYEFTAEFMRPPAELLSLPAEFMRSPAHFVSLPVTWYQEEMESSWFQ